MTMAIGLQKSFWAELFLDWGLARQCYFTVKHDLAHIVDKDRCGNKSDKLGASDHVKLTIWLRPKEQKPYHFILTQYL